MKTIIATLLVAIISQLTIYAQDTTSQVSEITCKFKKSRLKGNFSVAIANLNDAQEAELAEIYSNYEGEDTAFSFDGSEDIKWYYRLISSWDSGYQFDEKGNFVLSLDSDGCDVGILKLYKNTSYRYGFTRVKHNCSGSVPDTYHTLICQVQSK